MIRWVEDIIIPASVTTAYQLTGGHCITGIALCATGYGLAMFDIGGNYTKNLGIASLDWAVRATRHLIAFLRETGRYPSEQPGLK